MSGTKHLVQCHCVLPQYRKMKNPIFHKFVVYSQQDDTGAVKEKFSRCNNCEAVHRVYDLCKSEIAVGLDEIDSIMTIQDIIPSLPEKVAAILKENNSDLATFENVEDVIFNERWGEQIVLSRKSINSAKTQVKIIEFKSEEKFRIHTEIINNLTG